MAATVFDEGLEGIERYKTNNTTAPRTWGTVRLYTAISPAISKATLKADFTEATGMGYAAKSIVNGDFAYSTDTSNHWVTASGTYTWTFTAGAGMTILGYYILDSAGTKAVQGEQFASAVVIPAGGGSLQINITDKYQAC